MTQAAGTGGDLRTRVRDGVRDQVRLTAVDLMLDRGYAATTVEQIVQACGVSRRSFYRYFGTREDLVLGDTGEQIAVLTAALTARPLAEDAWTALQRAAESLPDAAQPAERAFGVARMINGDPDLRARRREKYDAWRSALTPLIVERAELAGSPLSPLGASALVACALSCLETAVEAWVDQGGRGTLESFSAEAVVAVRGL